MPNLVNRRRKKSKAIEAPPTLRSDSTDSDYEFSSKLNFKYNVLPEKIKSLQRDEKQEDHKIRYEIFFLSLTQLIHSPILFFYFIHICVILIILLMTHVFFFTIIAH